MVGELRLQRPLHQRSREALEKPLRTSQVLGLRLSRQQLVEQLAADLLVFLHRRPFPRSNDRPWRASSARYTELLTGSAPIWIASSSWAIWIAFHVALLRHHRRHGSRSNPASLAIPSGQSRDPCRFRFPYGM